MAIQANLSKVRDTMRFLGSPCWIMYCDEHSDPYFAQFVTPKTVVPAIAAIGQERCFAIVHGLDADNVAGGKDLRVIRYQKENALWEKLGAAIERLGYPPTISLTYSTMGDAQVDVLGVGMYRVLTKKLREAYSNRKKKVRFTSAEELVYAVSDRKNESDIGKMRIAARRALEILESTFLHLRPGMSELEAVELVHTLSQKKPAYFRKVGVIVQDFAWEKEMCPVVLAGPNLQKGGHAIASKAIIKEGQTVYFDFGVQLTFQDGSKWASDIQRMGYVLRPGENQAPPEVSRMFQTLVNAIRLGMKAVRPGMKGYEVDKIVRAYVRKAGYPDYNHATGHAIGQSAHNPGTLLGPKDRRLSRLTVQPNGVYSMEPRIPIANGGSVEEMVLVTETGGSPLCRPQESLYLVKSR